MDKRWHTGLLSAAILVVLAGRGQADGQACLVSLEREIAHRYSSVPVLLPEQFEAMRQAPVTPIVLDVREADEHAVSAIPGALRVDPGSGLDEVKAMIGDRLRGRPVVLYCSVGVRSSRLAERIGAGLIAAGAEGVYNLRGGVFAWHNTARPLVRTQGSTDLVHPYSRRWSLYIDFKNFTTFRAPR